MIHLIATLRVKPGKLQEVIAAATPCILATRREIGCLRYDMLVDIMDDTNVTFVEEWDSRAILARHIETEHVKTWQAASKPLLDSAKVEVIYPARTELI